MTLGQRPGSLFRGILRFLRLCFKWLCISIGATVLVVLVTTLIVGGFAARYIFKNRGNLPNIQSVVDFDVPQVGVIYDSNNKPVINLAKEFRLVIKPEEITLIIKQAFLSAEDREFYNHNGVDWYALLLRATGKNIERSVEVSTREGEPTLVTQQGASTITDQLIGLYYRDDIDTTVNKLAKTWWGFLPRKFIKKLEELRLSIWLEEELVKPQHFASKRTTKDEILARFLSYTYFRKVYGVKAASQYYFGKSFDELDYGEAALLAGIIKDPSVYAPVSNQSNSFSIQRQLSRRNNILDLMVENKHLTQVEADKFKETELPTPQDKRNHTEAPSVVGDILAELRSNGISLDKLFDGKIRVYSVGDLQIQSIANEALEEGIRIFEERHPESKGVVQGSVVVLRNSDAAVLAAVGGRKEYNNQVIRYVDFNRARHSLRQPGSAFKPFDYLAAFSEYWGLDDVIRDIPVAVPMGNGRPPHVIHNYDGKYKGTISVRKALFESRNAATVWLVRKIGIQKAIDIAYMLGIKTKLQPYPTTAIGASEVNLLELTNAYRAMASGIIADPYVIEKASDNSGQNIFQAQPQTSVVPLQNIFLEMIQEGLRGVVRIPGGTAYSLTIEKLPVPIGGKTGTTNDLRDALFIGFTYGPDGITVGAWIGYDDNRTLGDKETGARVALPVVKYIFREIYKQGLVSPASDFPELIEERIDYYLKHPK